MLKETFFGYHPKTPLQVAAEIKRSDLDGAGVGEPLEKKLSVPDFTGGESKSEMADNQDSEKKMLEEFKAELAQNPEEGTDTYDLTDEAAAELEQLLEELTAAEAAAGTEVEQSIANPSSTELGVEETEEVVVGEHVFTGEAAKKIKQLLAKQMAAEAAAESKMESPSVSAEAGETEYDTAALEEDIQALNAAVAANSTETGTLEPVADEQAGFLTAEQATAALERELSGYEQKLELDQEQETDNQPPAVEVEPVNDPVLSAGEIQPTETAAAVPTLEPQIPETPAVETPLSEPENTATADGSEQAVAVLQEAVNDPEQVNSNVEAKAERAEYLRLKQEFKQSQNRYEKALKEDYQTKGLDQKLFGYGRNKLSPSVQAEYDKFMAANQEFFAFARNSDTFNQVAERYNQIKAHQAGPEAGQTAESVSGSALLTDRHMARVTQRQLEAQTGVMPESLKKTKDYLVGKFKQAFVGDGKKMAKMAEKLKGVTEKMKEHKVATGVAVAGGAGALATAIFFAPVLAAPAAAVAANLGVKAIGGIYYTGRKEQKHEAEMDAVEQMVASGEEISLQDATQTLFKSAEAAQKARTTVKLASRAAAVAAGAGASFAGSSLAGDLPLGVEDGATPVISSETSVTADSQVTPAGVNEFPLSGEDLAAPSEFSGAVDENGDQLSKAKFAERRAEYLDGFEPLQPAAAAEEATPTGASEGLADNPDAPSGVLDGGGDQVSKAELNKLTEEYFDNYRSVETAAAAEEAAATPEVGDVAPDGGRYAGFRDSDGNQLTEAQYKHWLNHDAEGNLLPGAQPDVAGQVTSAGVNEFALSGEDLAAPETAVEALVPHEIVRGDNTSSILLNTLRQQVADHKLELPSGVTPDDISHWMYQSFPELTDATDVAPRLSPEVWRDQLGISSGDPNDIKVGEKLNVQKLIETMRGLGGNPPATDRVIESAVQNFEYTGETEVVERSMTPAEIANHGTEEVDKTLSVAESASLDNRSGGVPIYGDHIDTPEGLTEGEPLAASVEALRPNEVALASKTDVIQTNGAARQWLNSQLDDRFSSRNDFTANSYDRAVGYHPIMTKAVAESIFEVPANMDKDEFVEELYKQTYQAYKTNQINIPAYRIMYVDKNHTAINAFVDKSIDEFSNAEWKELGFNNGVPSTDKIKMGEVIKLVLEKAAEKINR